MQVSIDSWMTLQKRWRSKRKRMLQIFQTTETCSLDAFRSIKRKLNSFDMHALNISSGFDLSLLFKTFSEQMNNKRPSINIVVKCTVENANNEEALWKVAWYTENFSIWQLKCFVHRATLHEAKPGQYFSVWNASHYQNCKKTKVVSRTFCNKLWQKFQNRK